MGKIALSFLGTGQYEETTYRFEGQAYKTRFVQTAIRRHFKVERHFVFVTKAARAKHCESILQNGFKKSELIDVPDGRSEEELWELFSKITDIVPEESEIVFDVTHGFRIQPMLALAVMVYLRFQKQITISRICYGLFEKGAAENEILDVTAFLDVIDWSFALRRFGEKGDAGELADIMRKFHVKTYKGDQKYKAVSLTNSGSALKSLMDSLSVVRPEEAMHKVNIVEKLTAQIQPDLDHIYETKPLVPILESIKKNISGWKTEQGEDGKPALFSDSGIRAQLNMCRHYVNVGMHQQFLTLANELIVSAALVLHKEDPVDESKRSSVSYRLQGIGRNNHIGPVEQWEHEAGGLLRSVADIRNDVNHAGMRKDPKPAKSLISETHKLIVLLSDFLSKHFDPGIQSTDTSHE